MFPAGGLGYIGKLREGPGASAQASGCVGGVE
jgi:hypothetical protein